MDVELLKIITKQVDPDEIWYVMPVLDGFDVSVSVNEFSDIIDINSAGFSEEALRSIQTELEIPDDVAAMLIHKCKIAFDTVSDQMDLPESDKGIKTITVIGKLVKLDLENPENTDVPYALFINDIMLDEDPRQFLNLDTIHSEICRIIDLDFVPILFTGTLPACFEHLNKKLSQDSDFIITPQCPQYYKTGPKIGQRVNLRLIAASQQAATSGFAGHHDKGLRP